ncbi:hypothetical protein A2344_02900 [Candidatus Peregrinibacteria bacterium RIFOXYB12_FULL_41_12]|nr:MAG: hypothetical protein A2344_02900 [Candidatus Peregrinibacteria bacterium RIFOXYB12_FULL_41_12]
MSTTAFKKSIAWQKGYILVLEIYKSTDSFPIKERYGLTSQIRRSASSVVFNIAEGLLRNTLKELTRFFIISRGSCGELETQLMLAKDLGYITTEVSDKLIGQTVEIIRILNSSIKTLQAK